MKLFARVDRDEGQAGLTDAVFVWGKVYSWYLGKRDDVASHYFCFTLPFTAQLEYFDYSTFDKFVGPCRWRLLYRKHLKTGRSSWNSGWIPYP